MAYTVAFLSGGKAIKQGNKKVSYVDVTFTGSYATLGEALTAQDFAVKNIQMVTGIITEAAGTTTAWVPYYDRGTGKLKMMGAGTGATGLTEHAAAAYAASTVGHLVVTGT